MLVNAPDSAMDVGYETHLLSEGHSIVGKFLPSDDVMAEFDASGPDLLVFCTAAPQRPLLSIVETLSERGACPIILYSASDDAAGIRAAVKAGANAVAAGSGRHTEFRTLVQLAFAEHGKTLALRQERDAAVTKLTERKTVERAKGIIMKERNLDEDDAYRLLRKLAMDRSEPLINLATRVIEASQLLK